MRFTQLCPPIKELHNSIFPKTLIQLTTPNDYSVKSCHQHLSHPYSLPRTKSNCHSIAAPISPSFWQWQPTNQTAKLVQLHRCLTERRPKKFLKMYGPPTTIATSLFPSFQRQRLTDPTDMTQKFPFHDN